METRRNAGVLSGFDREHGDGNLFLWTEAKPRLLLSPQLGLIGVFPYSAIDMSTFEALKIAYCKSFDLEEPQTVAVLCFGALSGSIGATSVYRE